MIAEEQRQFSISILQRWKNVKLTFQRCPHTTVCHSSVLLTCPQIQTALPQVILRMTETRTKWIFTRNCCVTLIGCVNNIAQRILLSLVVFPQHSAMCLQQTSNLIGRPVGPIALRLGLSTQLTRWKKIKWMNRAEPVSVWGGFHWPWGRRRRSP